MKRQLITETFWAIGMPYWKDESKLALYCGTWLTRRDAISDHTRAKGWNWKRCKRHGDVCIKVKITAAK